MASLHLFLSPMLEFLRDHFWGQPYSWYNDTTLYSSLGKSGFFEKVESAGEPELDLRSILEWGDRWLVKFNATKTQLFSFNRHRDRLLAPVEMNGIALPK